MGVASHVGVVGATGGFEGVGNLDPGCNKGKEENYKLVLNECYESRFHVGL